ncbi:subclass B1 metallo-beta-lactamase [Paracnuella aquatica]|uniref:subclass B1 metallo-beta-lactamase n=1 Tax=Paracnuella aquatica TaxID=2268757 RepID=UPI000DEF7985|nr:subclass B1 metallo-beta-lactamase [Paracnuella aquatica]RPD43694.1 subclass B1 metallo-beta-lactamase [Paracnuella aquatica]
MFRFKYIGFIIFAVIIAGCSNQKPVEFQAKEVYQSGDLIVTQIAENSFQHTSFKQTNDFGNVPCNGLVVRHDGEAIVFDTPTNDTVATSLIQWINDSLKCKINAVIPTHFHDDCLGGLQAFTVAGIPSYANNKTIALARANNFAVPQHGFDDSLLLKVGSANIVAKFFGEGHTADNIVGYFPADRVLFGGCLIKELNAGKGYLGDAKVERWSNTVQKVKAAYPDVRIVVPGHGNYGNSELLDFTMQLFKDQ